MSTIPEPTEYVAAEDLAAGDRILYGPLVLTVYATHPATWHEGSDTVFGTEIECRQGSERLSLFRQRRHQFERISKGEDR